MIKIAKLKYQIFYDWVAEKCCKFINFTWFFSRIILYRFPFFFIPPLAFFFFFQRVVNQVQLHAELRGTFLYFHQWRKLNPYNTDNNQLITYYLPVCYLLSIQHYPVNTTYNKCSICGMFSLLMLDFTKRTERTTDPESTPPFSSWSYHAG